MSEPLSPALSPLVPRGENPPDNLGAPCASELGKDAFHRVPDFARNEWDAVERVLTISEDRFRGRDGSWAG
jgi:hypothetical protein